MAVRNNMMILREAGVEYTHNVPTPEVLDDYVDYKIEKLHILTMKKYESVVWVLRGHNAYKLINHWNRTDQWKYYILST